MAEPRILEVGYCDECVFWHEEPSQAGLGSTSRVGLCRRFTDNAHGYGKVIIVPVEDPTRPVRFETSPGFGCEAWEGR